MGLLRKLLTLSGTAFVAYNVGYSTGLDTGRSARTGRSMAEQVVEVVEEVDRKRLAAVAVDQTAEYDKMLEKRLRQAHPVAYCHDTVWVKGQEGQWVKARAFLDTGNTVSGFWGGGIVGVGSPCMVSQQLARSLGITTHPTKRQRSAAVGGDVHLEVSDGPLQFSIAGVEFNQRVVVDSSSGMPQFDVLVSRSVIQALEKQGMAFTSLDP
ncbi:hypothetical protein N2152v2_002726 [Parachlorella kessleri]